MKKPKNRIQKYLDRRGMTQGTLCELLEHHGHVINAASMSRWCTNTFQPPINVLKKIAVVLDTTMEDLTV